MYQYIYNRKVRKIENCTDISKCEDFTCFEHCIRCHVYVHHTKKHREIQMIWLKGPVILYIYELSSTSKVYNDDNDFEMDVECLSHHGKTH